MGAESLWSCLTTVVVADIAVVAYAIAVEAVVGAVELVTGAILTEMHFENFP